MTSCIDRISRASRLNLAALAVAGLALFVALGGTSYAAGLLIGTKQIKDNAVNSKKIKDNRVASSRSQEQRGAIGGHRRRHGSDE